MAQKINNAGLEIIKKYESCKLTAYKPVATETYYTIGWGHYGADVAANAKITQAEADKLLVADVAKFENYVNNATYCPVTAQLNTNQFSALVSFAYNCGAGNLKKLCTGKNIAQIGNTLTSYNKAGGKVLAGLTKRRNEELALYNTPVSGGKNSTPTENNGLISALKNIVTTNKPKNPYTEPKAEVKKGNTGDGVKWVQWELQRKGYSDVAVDGIFGNKTETAVKSIQSINKITVNGIVNSVTKAYLKK